MPSVNGDPNDDRGRASAFRFWHLRSAVRQQEGSKMGLINFHNSTILEMWWRSSKKIRRLSTGSLLLHGNCPLSEPCRRCTAAFDELTAPPHCSLIRK